jgi:hypothetical protein
MDHDRFAEAIVREAAEAIVASDPNGVIAAWNGGAERVEAPCQLSCAWLAGTNSLR